MLLTDEQYNYRNEILDFNRKIDFISENGKTTGALAPNEFWYFFTVCNFWVLIFVLPFFI